MKQRTAPRAATTDDRFMELLETRRTVWNLDRLAGLPALLVKQMLEDLNELGDFPIESLRQEMWMSREVAEQSLQALAAVGLVQPSSQGPSSWSLGPRAPIVLRAESPRRIDAREVKETFFRLMEDIGAVADAPPRPYWIASASIRPTLFQDPYERSSYIYVKVALGMTDLGVIDEGEPGTEQSFLALKKKLEHRFQMLHEALCVEVERV